MSLSSILNSMSIFFSCDLMWAAIIFYTYSRLHGCMILSGRFHCPGTALYRRTSFKGLLLVGRLKSTFTLALVFTLAPFCCPFQELVVGCAKCWTLQQPRGTRTQSFLCWKAGWHPTDVCSLWKYPLAQDSMSFTSPKRSRTLYGNHLKLRLSRYRGEYAQNSCLILNFWLYM